MTHSVSKAYQPLPIPRGIRDFQRRLLSWHRDHAKDYPWRHTEDPYLVLVAEILLQQTDAPKVVPVYNSFVHRFPTIQRLAAARAGELSTMLRTLGLTYRAPRLLSIARQLIDRHKGQVPDSEEVLLTLSGVGRYIARSVCAAAFGQREGVLDTNIIRILHRCFGIRTSRTRAREDKALWDLVNRMVPPRSLCAPAQWNWALLDFASLYCSHHCPKCPDCPMEDICRTRSTAGRASLAQRHTARPTVSR